MLQRYGYCRLPTIDLLDLFPSFNETLNCYSFLEGTCLITDLALLKMLAKRYHDCEYLEIGTWRGESLANVAEIAVHCTSVNLSPSEIRKMGMSEEYVKVHFVFSKSLGNVTYIGHDSRTFDFASLGKRFDLIFIDGDHAYKSVKIDTGNAFNLLRDEDSVIVWHDYGFTPETVRSSVLAGILDGCPYEHRENLYHVSNTMCAIYARQKFKTKFVIFPEMPNKLFKISVSASRFPQDSQS